MQYIISHSLLLLESCQFKSAAQLRKSLSVYHTEAFKAKDLYSPEILSGAAQVAGSWRDVIVLGSSQLRTCLTV